MEGRMKRFMTTFAALVGLMILAAISGCTTYEYKTWYPRATTVPHYDVPPQVIYRIDDHRFVSLENYDLCYGDAYYNDTRQQIHYKLGRGSGFETFRGRFIVDDPTGMNVVLPTAPAESCGSRGCQVSLVYSTDGGRTFRGKVYMNSFDPSEDSERYTIAVTKDGFYVVKQMQYDAYVIKYPLVKDINLSEPYPTGLHDERFWSSKKPTFLAGLRTPSGQEHFTCDKTIRPSNLGQQ
jgi:hypothetical protein